ncbi:MAG: hypothetical protein Q8M16_01805 [Pirellulaceae bacterium]|nr:hypothetical protein [Pirellulaceae bacterium]
MLSGFGGDDPMGGGTGGTGGGSSTDGGAGGGIIGGGGYTGPTAGIGGPATSAGSGFNDYNHLTLSAHWLYGVSGDYAWNHTSSLLDYTTRHANEDTSGVFYRATTNKSDKDLGTYFVTFATYNWNVNVSASSSSSGPQGGSTGDGSGAWYREELSVSVTGFTIETTDTNIASAWQAAGSFGDFNIANYTQVATIVPNSNASYSYHATIDPNDYYSAVDVDVAENLDVTKDYDTSLDWLLDREGYTDQNRVISGHLTISGSTAYTKQTEFNATRAQDVWTFGLVGSETSYSQETYTYVDARLVTTTVGYVPVEIAHHTTAPRRPKLDSQGNPLPEPPEGTRFIWEKDGTIAYESDSTLEFQGSGAYSYLGDQWIRTGDVYSTFYDSSSYENNYESTIQTDETMVGATILTETNGRDSFEYIVKAGTNSDIQLALFHDRRTIIDRSAGESQSAFRLKRSYFVDGRIVTETESVTLPGETSARPSFSSESHSPDLTVDSVNVVQLHRYDTEKDSTEYTRSSNTTQLIGQWDRNTTFDTTYTTGQPGFEYERLYVGTVNTNGSRNTTVVSDTVAIDSYLSWNRENDIAGSIEIGLEGTEGNDDPLYGDSLLVNTLNVTAGKSLTTSGQYEYHYDYRPDKTIVVTDTSSFLTYYTRLSMLKLDYDKGGGDGLSLGADTPGAGNAEMHFRSGTRQHSRICALQGKSSEFHYIRNP